MNLEKENTDEIIQKVTDLILDKKGYDITIINLKDIAAFADYLILCSADSSRQAQTISDYILEELKALGAKPLHTEGYNQASWILMDYVDFLVNIFDPETRRFYSLERLWKDAPTKSIAGDR